MSAFNIKLQSVFPETSFLSPPGVLIFDSLSLYLLPWWLSGKESACGAGDSGSIPGLGRSPGGGHGNPAQYSCLENSMDRGTWQATVHRSQVIKSSLYFLRPK